MKECSVCRGEVEEADAASDSRMIYYFGCFYYLMCHKCKNAFMKEPDRYTGKKFQASALVPWSCDPVEDDNNVTA